VSGIWIFMEQSTKREQGKVFASFLLTLPQNCVLINWLLIAQIIWPNMKLLFRIGGFKGFKG